MQSLALDNVTESSGLVAKRGSYSEGICRKPICLCVFAVKKGLAGGGEDFDGSMGRVDLNAVSTAVQRQL